MRVSNKLKIEFFDIIISLLKLRVSMNEAIIDILVQHIKTDTEEEWWKTPTINTRQLD